MPRRGIQTNRSDIQEEVNKILQVKCKKCRMEYDESKMHKSMIYYNISEEAKEFRKNGAEPYVFGQGIVSIFDRLSVTEEEKIRFRYLLERDYEKRACRLYL